MLNLAHFLDVTAEKYPDNTAVILDDFKMTWRELAAFTHRVANILRSKGIGKGDTVAMMVPNTPHFPMIYYGILHTGAAVVPVNVMYRHNEIEHYLIDSEAKVFFAFKVFEEEARKAFLAAENCKDFIVISSPDDLEDPTVGENFTKIMMEADSEFDTFQTMPDDTAVILYTSGTTGMPKGAELTHFNMFFNAYHACNSILHLTPKDVALVTLPLFHSFGQTCMMNASILGGGGMTMLPRFETEKAMQVIERDRVTVVALVPTMYFFMLNTEKHSDYDLSSIRMAVSGGAALPEETHRRFRERHDIVVQEGYGLSETSPISSFTVADEEVRVGSIGKPIWGVEMRIKMDDGSFGGVNDVGEIVIRGHNVMKRYLNRPQATQEAIIDGWFHTGDVGRYDEDGYFYIVDRKKDIIIRGGMNIYPREIEEVLYAHPKVFEVSVVGVPDPARGEEVKAYLSPLAGETITPEEIHEYLQQRIARYKWPRDIEVLAELPKGPTGKILKRELKLRAAQKSSGG
jgi:long-chain acyl-CoA synthetase